jgi:tetratricopeptide (TPR) repeat protein
MPDEAPKQPPDNENTLGLFAAELPVPPPAPEPPPIAPRAVDRQVRGPGFRIAARNFLRRNYSKLRDWVNAHKMIAVAVSATLLTVILIAIVVVRSSKPAETRGHKLARQGNELLHQGNAKEAAELLESELVGKSETDDGQAYLVLGHARYGTKRYLDAMTAYERALTLQPKLATDADLKKNAAAVLDTKDSVAAMVALEILASRVQPPANDVIVAYASTGKLADVRRRAFAIAEREGIADKVDKVESWSLDLANAQTCEDRRALVAKLASTKDRRAIPALKRAKLYKCAEKDATDAIEALEGGAPSERAK